MISGPLSVNALRNSRIALSDCVVSCEQVIDFVRHRTETVDQLGAEGIDLAFIVDLSEPSVKR